MDLLSISERNCAAQCMSSARIKVELSISPVMSSHSEKSFAVVFFFFISEAPTFARKGKTWLFGSSNGAPAGGRFRDRIFVLRHQRSRNL
jgi:hypothetical protein